MPHSIATIDSDSAYQEIADDIWSAISGPFAGRSPDTEWQCPWHGLAKLPTNPFTGQAFHGSNVLRLWSVWRKRNYTSHFWASHKAWTKAGAMVRDPSSAVRIFMPVLDENRLINWGKGSRNVGPLGYDPEGGTRSPLLGFRAGFVINRDETTGGDIPPEGTAENYSPIPEAEKLIAGYLRNQGPALVHGGTRALYSPAHDRIHMPPREAFADRRGLAGAHWYASVLLHESVHSTGSKSRLNRNLKSLSGSVPAAREELVAELGAAFLGATIGLATELRGDHEQYVRSWISCLKNARKDFFIASAKAQKAAAFIAARSAGLSS